MNKVSDNSQVTQVIKDFGKQLLRFISYRVDNEEDAEDILQDVWYQFSATVTVNPIEQVSSWLYKVASNKIIDRYRKRSTDRLEDETLYDDEGEELGFKEFLLRENNDPETEYVRSLFWQELYLALDEMPEEQKQVFVLNELEDVSFKDISDMTGVNIKTLISRKRYAVMYLRKRLKTLYDEIIQY